MAKTTNHNTIVLLDDELFHMIWMIDFLKSKGINYLPASNANEAFEILEREIYRAIIIDLNVPILAPLDNAARSLGDVYLRYPGLFVARAARNKGYRNRQVVLYSVHKDDQVSKEAVKLGCTYILKGRPKEIKEELLSVLEFDPTSV